MGSSMGPPLSANQGDYGNGLEVPQLIVIDNTHHHSTTISRVKSQCYICDHEASSDSQFTIASYNQSTILSPVHDLLWAEMVLPFSIMFLMPREVSQCGNFISTFMRAPCEISIPWNFFQRLYLTKIMPFPFKYLTNRYWQLTTTRNW